MPTYEFRCRRCDEVFEVRRPMSGSGDPATCPDGHADTVRLLSVFARAGVADASGARSAPVMPGAGGGCCGGACGCG